MSCDTQRELVSESTAGKSEFLLSISQLLLPLPDVAEHMPRWIRWKREKENGLRKRRHQTWFGDVDPRSD